jgi:GAF domain-containing protein
MAATSTQVTPLTSRTPERPPGPADGLWARHAELIGLLHAEETYDQTLQRVVRLACATVRGCVAASVTMWREETPYTVVSSHDLARVVDEAQYRAGAGPCLAASRDGHVYAVEDMAAETRWPEFATSAASHGARSSLSVPLTVRDRPLGALNMYGTVPGGFRDGRELGELYGVQAAVAIANAEVYRASRALAARLEASLRARAVVERATGVLMVRYGVGVEAAAELLRRAADQNDMPLHEFAERLTDGPRSGLPDSVAAPVDP